MGMAEAEQQIRGTKAVLVLFLLSYSASLDKIQANTPRGLMPESIGITIPENSIDVPDPSNEIVTQNQSEEKWDGFAISSNATIFQ